MFKLSENIHNYFTQDVLIALNNKRINNTIDFLDYDVKSLSEITKITYREILDIKKHIISKFSAKVLYGDSYYDYLLNKLIITPTNITSFDILLNGGLSNGTIYEICGFTSSGKTQLCLTIALNISQFQFKSVYFIDTKRDFSSKRLQNILEAKQTNEDEVAEILNRIKIKQINDEYQLMSVLYEIKNANINSNCPLIIIDSLPAIFYRSGNQSASLTTANEFVNVMRLMCADLNVSFLLTNIMIKDSLGLEEAEKENPSRPSPSDLIKPGLGTYWSTIPNVRIMIEKCHNQVNQCRMTVIKSSATIECNKMCDVTINDFGVV